MIYLDEERRRIIEKHIENGVTVTDTEGLIIGANVVIEAGAVIEGNNRITGKTTIGEEAVIKSGNVIENAQIGALCRVEKSIIKDSRIDSNTTVTMAHVHSGSSIGRDCRIGNFVEIKNSRIGKADKIAHLAYVGDTDMGDYCNVGCGAIFVNYDGKNKHRSIVGDSVFIGSNCNIIAPVKLEDKAFIAAGTTVTKDLPCGCMCIGRDRETIKENRSRYGKVKNKLFGTDGIRGIYGEFLTEQIAYMTGNFLGYSSDGGVVTVGRDTRISGSALEDALIKGILDAGSDAVRIGVTTTPIAAYSIEELGANYGVMITASHNPPEYNGIKIFNSDCGKLGELEEAEIERHILSGKPIVRLKRGEVHDGGFLAERYIDKVVKFLNLSENTGGKRIKAVIDAANGGASAIAAELYRKLGVDAEFINADGDGGKINCGCGATAVTALREAVLKERADIGIAFDGDADRVIAVDENGGIIDGDSIIYILAHFALSRGKLDNRSVACTVLSNLGLKKALEELKIDVVYTDVGDHNVVNAMKSRGISIGGEQSGHIIYSEFMATGDGVFTGAHLIKIMSETGKKLSELNKIVKYPQIMRNIKIKDKSIAVNPEITEQVAGINAYYGDKARLLVRPSGTEPFIRVMAEAITEELAAQIAELAVRNIEKLSNY